MSEIFLKIINMSISASYIVLAVLLLRLLLKKAPKWITVVLWGIVAVRLVCPFSMESVFSLIPSAEVVSPDIMMDRTPEINTGIPIINSTINPVISESFTPNPGDSANPLQIWIPMLTTVWIVGMAALLIYTAISYARVKRRIGTAVLYKDNIYQSENVVSPFVLGIIKPKIYLPFNMNEKDMEHVVAHEMAHIRRKDHLWKPLGFILLTLHWFNPLMWLGYILLCRDIELACDEKVIKELDHDARADYSEALLTCSVNRRMIAACPLAFGEVGAKQRIKSVLNYKKPAFWIVVLAVIACIAVAVCFLTNPLSNKPDFTVMMEEFHGLLQPVKVEVFIDGLTYKDVHFQINDTRYEIATPPTVSDPEYRLTAVPENQTKAVRLRMNPDEISRNVTLYMLFEDGVERVYVCDFNEFDKLLSWQNSGMRVDMEAVEYQIFINPVSDEPSPQNIVLSPQHGTFQFSFSMNYADCLSGTYLTTGDTLLLKDDEGALYTFMITESGLVFDAEHSAKISKSHYHSTKKDDYPVPDGTVFVPAETQRQPQYDHLREKYPNEASGQSSRDFIMDLRGDAMKDGHSHELRAVAERIAAAVWNPGETCATLFVHNCTDVDWGLFSINLSNYYYRVIEIHWDNHDDIQ